MKITISQGILAILEHGATCTIDIAWAMSASRETSYKRLKFISNHPDKSMGTNIIREWKTKRDDYKRYHALLSRLEEQGLVYTETVGVKKCWQITKTGHTFLQEKKLIAEKNQAWSQPGGVTVVSYDIPERMRTARSRLREMLNLAGFEIAHKSVWFGNKKLTRQFIAALRELHIFDYVHIFEISKSGTLKSVKDNSKS